MKAYKVYFRKTNQNTYTIVLATLGAQGITYTTNNTTKIAKLLGIPLKRVSEILDCELGQNIQHNKYEAELAVNALVQEVPIDKVLVEQDQSLNS